MIETKLKFGIIYFKFWKLVSNYISKSSIYARIYNENIQKFSHANKYDEKV